MAYGASVIETFETHKPGDLITDPAEVKRVLEGPHARHVRRVGLPPELDPTAAQPAKEG